MTFDDPRFKLVVNNKSKDANKKSDKQKYDDKLENLINKGTTLFESAILSDIPEHEKMEYLLKAEKYFLEAKKLAPYENEKIYTIYLFLGDIYINLMNFNQAFGYYFKVKEDIEQIESIEPGSVPDECKYYVYYNIGKVKIGLGTIDKKDLKKHWEEAKNYLLMAEKAEDVPRELKAVNDKSLYYFLGIVSLFEKTDESLEKAKEYFTKVLQMDWDGTYNTETMLERVKEEQNIRRSLKAFEDSFDDF